MVELGSSAMCGCRHLRTEGGGDEEQAELGGGLDWVRPASLFLFFVFDTVFFVEWREREKRKGCVGV